VANDVVEKKKRKRKSKKNKNGGTGGMFGKGLLGKVGNMAKNIASKTPQGAVLSSVMDMASDDDKDDESDDSK